MPEVVAAAAVTTLPLNPVGIDYRLPFEISGESAGDSGATPRIDFRVASPNYFRTLGIPLLGRDFTTQDRAGTPKVVIVNRALARRFFGSSPPLSREVLLGGGIGRAEIVGVVGDVRHGGLDVLPVPEMYVPLAQYPHGGMTLVVRSRNDPSHLAASVTGHIHALDPALAVSQLTTVPQLLSASVSRQRFTSFLLGSFAAVALAVAALGIYGVLAYIVGRQTPEIGVRLALGARPLSMMSGVLRQGLSLAAAGIGVGVAGALLATRLLGGLLHDIPPHDPATYSIIVLVFLAVATLACAVPARRAARVDPIIALRSE
jgi:putative ABC transport system permease protein